MCYGKQNLGIDIHNIGNCNNHTLNLLKYISKASIIIKTAVGLLKEHKNYIFKINCKK